MKTLHDIRGDGNFTLDDATLEKMCEEVNAAPHKVYDIISAYGGESDSVTRETVFSYIATKYREDDYEAVYQEWLGR